MKIYKTIHQMEGFLFVTSGCEHGPTIMKWLGEWDQAGFEKVKDDSYCDNEFEGGFYEKTALTCHPELTPGKVYRITIDELLPGLPGRISTKNPAYFGPI